MENNLHVRLSILNPGFEVSPLKFRGWLRAEAAQIDQMSRASGMPHQVTIIRLFVPTRLFFAIGEAALDKTLQQITDKFETIYRIELRVVDNPLTLDEMCLAEEEAQQDLQSIDEDDEPRTDLSDATLH